MIGYNLFLSSRKPTNASDKGGSSSKGDSFSAGAVFSFCALVVVLIISGYLSFVIFMSLFCSFIYDPTVFGKYGSGWSAAGIGMLSGTSLVFLKAGEAIMQRIDK